MDSIFDILVKEIASILGISREEVISRFTQEELDDILNNSLCEPVDTIGGQFDNIDSIPCAPSPPEFLPEANADEVLANLSNEIEKKKKEDPTKCVDSIKEVNKKVEEQTRKYSNHKILLDKLIEYRDSYLPIKYYFEEKSKEAARVFKIFSPLLEEKNRLEDNRTSLQRKISQKRREKGEALLLQNTELVNRLSTEISTLSRESAEISLQLGRVDNLIRQQENTIPIFRSNFFNEVLSFLGDSAVLPVVLGRLANNFIDDASFQSIKSQVSSYSETIKVGRDNRILNNLQDAISSNYFTFEINFPSLDYIVLDQENYDEQTGARSISKVNFYIKESELLTKNSFFKNSNRVSITQFNNDRLPNGNLYTQYYNLFEDPINNFFQLSERGLTENESVIDTRVRGTAAEKKKEGGREFFVQNLDTLQSFYQNFEESLAVRSKEVKEQNVVPLQESIRVAMQKLARQEIQLVLALGGVNRFLPNQSQFLDTINKRLEEEGQRYATGARELDAEIARIEDLLVELKPTPDKVKELLKKSNPECFGDIDRPSAPCPDVNKKLGSDPFGIKSIKEGADPTLPNQNQLCYWLEFSKVLNLVGLLPLPNIPKVTQLRYWPVGLLIPTPAGLVKVPLPVIYLPLIVISTPLGNIVFFLTINGVFISPVVFFVSSSGFKQLIVTVRGSSEKFGYDKEDQSIKSNIQIPVSVEAALEKAKKATLEAINGKDQHLSEEEKTSLNMTRRILKRRIEQAEANGNTIAKERAERKLKQVEKAAENKGPFEKLEEFLNSKDSPLNLISNFKQSINKSLARAGQPEFRKSQEKKDKIVSEREKQRREMRQAMIDNRKEKVAELRKKIKEEAVSLEEKFEAIEQDLVEYFNKIKFPKVRIPKNKEAIDPKQNAIISFIEDIIDFSEIYGTQVFSVNSKKVGKKFLQELAKANDDITEYINERLNSEDKVDLEKEPEKGKDIFKGIADIIIERIKGRDTRAEVEDIETQIKELQVQLNAQTDRVEKKKIERKIRRLQAKASSLNDVYLNFITNSLSPTTLAGFNRLGIDFNPFSPCCTKSPFSLSLDSGPTLAILETVKAIIVGIIDGYDKEKLIQLFSGKKQVNSNEIKMRFTGILKQIPQEIELPVPDFDTVKFLEISSKLLLPLFEPKAPITAAQPALPLSITIDLNILKEPLLKLLLSFLKSLLPDLNQMSPNSDAILRNSQGNMNIGSPNSTKSLEGNFDDELNIIDCSSPGEQPADQNGPFSEVVSPVPKQNPVSNNRFSTSNIYISSSKSVFPTFQNIATRFIDITPEDLVAIIIEFFELNLEKLTSLLEPFYSLLDIVKPTRSANLNIIEAAQYKVPPYGPPNEVRFTAITKLKQSLPKSANFTLINTKLVESLFPVIEEVLTPIASSPLPAILVAGAGALDSILPQIKSPVVDSTTGIVSTQDLKINKLALRQLHPLLNQDDLPPWERLTAKNILFLLFLDDFAATTADQVGFFREFV